MTASYRVLVAEDEPIFGKTVARFLQERGHKVKVCDAGEGTLEAVGDAEWDVLLLDLKLPDTSGVDVLTRVRERHEDLQTIILTGNADVESAISTMRLGAFDYLTKPPKFEELGVRVEKAGEKTALGSARTVVCASRCNERSAPTSSPDLLRSRPCCEPSRRSRRPARPS